MCGFAGIFDLARSTPYESLMDCVMRMADTLRHRGPSDRGGWADSSAGIALGFRRLSIIDLSPHGHQPMSDHTGRYVICFNGEIYNAPRLLKQLQQEWPQIPPLRGHSDTEILLRAISHWGLVPALERSIGMFAFALWDRKERQLHLARDRMGEKPLYYGWCGETFLFGSELKALRIHPQFRADIDREALAVFLRYGYVPGPVSIYRQIHKLPPGTLLTVTNSQIGTRPQPTPYWSPKQIAEAGQDAPFSGTESEAVDALEGLLRDAISMQMVADVPIGAFLSGGIDSSTIVALMQAQSGRPVRTFTIGFHEAAYNEAEYAKAVAGYLKTDHTELYVTPQQSLDVIPKLPALYDEPFADECQIPVYLVSALARQHVTVSLSGDGGDELFAGYSWYPRAASLWNKLSRVPRPLRWLTSAALGGLPAGAWDGLLRPLPARLRGQLSGDRICKLSNLIGRSRTLESTYDLLISRWNDDGSIVPGTPPPLHYAQPECWSNGTDPIHRLMYRDMTMYLPDDIMAKVDRASMGVSLESRAPLLDHRIVEFAWRLPLSMKFRDGTGKWLLRQVLYRHVPRNLIERPKMGFQVPIDSWLRGPLKQWAGDLLNEGRLRRDGFLDAGLVTRRFQDHLSGRRNFQKDLWNVLMFQSWLDATRGALVSEPPLDRDASATAAMAM